MDAQALLTPDAVDHEMGRPLAHVPDQVDDGHASYARHHAQTFIDTFAGLGIHPDRYYWMSDIYPTGEMDPFIRTALDRAALVRDIYRRVANVRHPDTWHPIERHLPELRQGRHDDRHRVGRRPRALRVPAVTGDVGTRLRRVRLDLAVRRECQAALEPRMGGPVVAVRRDHRTVRQGPGHGRWLARPVGHDRARGLRARTAAQRPVRVPQHRRQEDVDLQGPRRRRAHDRRGRAARAAPVPVPAATGPITRSTSIPTAPTRSRGCSTSSTSSRPRPPVARSSGELPPGYEATFRYSLLDPDADVAAEAAAFRPAFGHLAMLIQIPGVDVVERVEPEKGSALTDREVGILDRASGGGPRLAGHLRPRDGALADPARRGAAEPPPSWTRRSAVPGAVSPSGVTRGARPRGDAWQTSIFVVATEEGVPGRSSVRGHLSRIPRSAEWPACGLAAGQPRSGRS